MKKYSLLVCSALLSSVSLAQTPVAPEASSPSHASLVFQHPAAHKHNLDIGHTLFSKRQRTNVNGIEEIAVDQENRIADFSYKYGISPAVALGFATTWGRSTTSMTTGSTSGGQINEGFSDLVFSVLVRRERERSLVRYGLNLGVSPGNAVVGSTIDQGNRYSGGTSVEPYIGVECRGALATWGLAGKFKYRFDRKEVYPSETTTATGGSQFTFTPYVEVKTTQAILALQADISHYLNSSRTVFGTTNTTKAHTLAGATISSRFDFSEALALRLGLTYELAHTPVSSETSNLLTAQGWTGNIGAIFTF